MFINHELKAIFLHNPKCGGVYVREILIKYYGFKDVANKTHDQYDSFFPEDEKEFINYFENTDKHTIRCKGKYRYFYSHQEVDPKWFDEYFVFTFVRNPYDKLYSAYLYLKRHLESTDNKKIRDTTENPEYYTDFKTFVQNYKKVNNIAYFHGFITQEEQFIDSFGKMKINYVGTNENLDNDLIEIMSILGINEIKHIHEIYFDRKQNCSKKEENVYDQEMIDFVNQYFRRDFELFGYKMVGEPGKYHCEDYDNTSRFTELKKEIIEYKNKSLLCYNIKLLVDINNKFANIIEILLNEIIKENNVEKRFAQKIEMSINELFQENKMINIDKLDKNICSLRESKMCKCTQCNFIPCNELSNFTHDFHCK
jgi:hypothetical protein